MSKRLQFSVVGIFLCIFSPSARCAGVQFDSGQCAVDSYTTALLHLDDGAGTSVSDASGHNNNGLLIGNTPPQWFVPGLFGGRGLHLAYGYNNTANKCGAIQLANGLLNQQNLTVEMYVNWDYQSISANPSDAGNLGYLITDGSNLYVKSSMDFSVPPFIRCQLIFGVNTSKGLLQVNTPGTYSLASSKWTQVAFCRSYNGTATTISIYINGQLAVSGSNTGSPSLGGHSALIGSNNSGNVSWGGGVDEIRVSNIARTQFCNGASAKCGNWGYLPGDVIKSCYVSMADLGAIAQNWLLCPGTMGDIDNSGCVNFGDYSLFACNWLSCTDPCNPQLCNFAEDQLVTLENSHYRCLLGIGSGASNRLGIGWLRMFNKDLQTDYLRQDGPMPIFMVFGNGFVVDSYNFTAGSVSETAVGSGYRWQIPLSCAANQLNAQLTIDVNDSDKMVWSLSITNTAGAARKLQPIFPVMSRLTIGNSLTDNQYFYPFLSGIVGSVDCDLRCEYGNVAWMQIVSIFNPTIGAGLCTYPQDSSGGWKGMPFKKSYSLGSPTISENQLVAPLEQPNMGDPNLAIDVIAGTTKGISYTYYYPKIQIAAGGTYSLPGTAIRVYDGGWKEALADYSAWAHTWYTHVNTPQWFYDIFNTVGGWPPYYSSGSGYTLAATMGNPDPMQFDQWFGWWDGYDPNVSFAGAGDFNYNAALGGLTAFKNEISAVQAKGTRVTVYMDNRFCWQGTATGQAHGQAWSVMDPPGVYPVYQTAADKWLECSYEPNAWVDYMAQTCGRIIHDTNMSGIYLDELPMMYPCYNPNHVHYQQDGFPFSTARMQQYLTEARSAMQQQRSDAILMTEHAGSDYFTQFIDGSWSETFAFTSVEQYFDGNSLNYFRFCFPEFKLAEWGPSNDWENRCFFNGIGICDYPLSGFLEMSGQMLKENGDAFASKHPQPLVTTKITNVLANEFPASSKTVYTFYNKTATDFNNVPIIEVARQAGYHYVEMYYDSNAISIQPNESNDILTFGIKAGQVLCVAQLPQIISATRNGNTVNVSLAGGASGTLVAFFNYDTSTWGYGNGVVVPLTNGQGQFTIPSQSVRCSKIILKLYSGELLVDELVMGGLPVAGQGTLIQWNLSEGSPATVSYDSAGNHDLLIRSPWYWITNAPFGKGLAANSNCHTYCSSWLNPDDITTAMTVSAWVHITGVDPNGGMIIAMDNKFQLREEAGGTAVSFVVYLPLDQFPNAPYPMASVEPLGAGIQLKADNSWHQITGVYNGVRDANGNANVYLYWDGALKATTSFAIPGASQPLMSGGSSIICIGALPARIFDTSTNYIGGIDNITIKNVAQP